MKLVSMKTGDHYAASLEMDNPYGYGLRLCLNPEQCKALGLTEPLKAGSKVNLTAVAVVMEATEEVDKPEGGETEARMSLQVTDLGLQQASGFYPNSNHN
ncbi:capsid staple protein [Asticcacaulis sp.]|uniref:capsid staple protein n=1 Tax=Asticcacaulis sp. TaxID=1872648 RepID=UPI0031D40189